MGRNSASAGCADSLPPQCGGPDIDGWSWDAIDAEQSASGTTWVDAYVTGTYDATANRFTVDGARAPTEADRDSIGADGSQPDYGVPCPEPTGAGRRASRSGRATR